MCKFRITVKSGETITSVVDSEYHMVPLEMFGLMKGYMVHEILSGKPIPNLNITVERIKECQDENE